MRAFEAGAGEQAGHVFIAGVVFVGRDMALVAGLVGVDAAAVWMDAVFAGEDFIEAVPVAPDGDIVAFALEDGGAIGLGEVLMAFVAALVEDFRGQGGSVAERLKAPVLETGDGVICS